jgi:hypothetical protein
MVAAHAGEVGYDQSRPSGKPSSTSSHGLQRNDSKS